MTTAKFKALLEAAREEASKGVERRRAELRKADIRRTKEASEKEAHRKKVEAAARKRQLQRAATLSAIGEVLNALERTLTRTSKHISAESPRPGALVLTASYWSVREGRRISIRQSKLSINVDVDDGSPDKLKVRIGRKTVRASAETLADTLERLVLPVMAKYAAEAEVAVHVDLSDDYERLNE